MTECRDSIDVAADGLYPNFGIYSFGRGVFTKAPIDGSQTSAKQLNRVRAGQFIYSRLFAFEGAYAFVPAAFDGYFVSNEFPSFDVDPTVATAEFIAAALRSPQTWRELAGSSKGLGLRRQRIKVDALLAHSMWFPPIEEQHRIVAGLRKLDDVNRLLERSDALVAALVPSALNLAFAGLS
jgi:type I restriction enzyme S subunit